MRGVSLGLTGAVSLTIDQSELAAIVGPPGAGKTTLLHLMATLGQDRPGRTRAGGRPARRRAGRSPDIWSSRGGGRLEAHPSARPPNAARPQHKVRAATITR